MAMAEEEVAAAARGEDFREERWFRGGRDAPLFFLSLSLYPSLTASPYASLCARWLKLSSQQAASPPPAHKMGSFAPPKETLLRGGLILKPISRADDCATPPLFPLEADACVRACESTTCEVC